MQRLDLKNITKKTNGIILIPVSWYCWLTIFVMHSSYSICPQILELKLIKIFLHTPHNNCQSFYCCCTNIILNHTIKLNIVKSHAVSFTRINYLLPQTLKLSSQIHPVGVTIGRQLKFSLAKFMIQFFFRFVPFFFFFEFGHPNPLNSRQSAAL